MDLRDLLNKKKVMFLLVLPFLEPFGTEDMGKLFGGAWGYFHTAFIMLKWLSFACMALLFLVKFRKKISIISILLVAYQAWVLVITILSGGFHMSNLAMIATSIGAALLLEYYMQFGNTKKFLGVVEGILLFWIVINLVSMIVYPDGMYTDARLWTDNWILGYKNRHIYYYLPFLFISATSQYIKYKRLTVKYFGTIAIIVVSALLSKSITTTIAIILFTGLVFIIGKRELPEWLDLKLPFIVSVVVSGLIILMGFQSYFSFFLTDILGKDTTLTARTYIWSRALVDFSDQPIFGNGLIGYSDIFRTWTVSQMHNMYLDILVVGGIVLAAIFTITILHLNKKYMEYKVLILKNICFFCFTSYAVLFIAEARRDMSHLYMFFVLMAYLQDISEKYNLPSEYKNLIKIQIGKK